MLEELLKSALDVANQAVLLENQYKIDDALNAYRNACSKLQLVIDAKDQEKVVLTPEQEQQVWNILQRYKDRIKLLSAGGSSSPSSLQLLRPRPECKNTSIPEKDSSARCFWIISVLQKSLTAEGGYLTPRVFLSPVIWHQHGAKLAGVSEKISTLEDITYSFERLRTLSSSENQILVQHALDLVVEKVDKHCTTLSRLFPNWLSQADSATTPSSSSSSTTGGSLGSSLSNLASGFGKMVKRQAAIAAERVAGAAVPTKTAKVQLEQYAAVLSDFFDQSKYLSQKWKSNNEQQLVLCAAASSEAKECIRKILEFIEKVVRGIVLKDVKILLQRHVRKVMKASFQNLPTNVRIQKPTSNASILMIQ